MNGSKFRDFSFGEGFQFWRSNVARLVVRPKTGRKQNPMFGNYPVTSQPASTLGRLVTVLQTPWQLTDDVAVTCHARLTTVEVDSPHEASAPGSRRCAVHAHVPACKARGAAAGRGAAGHGRGRGPGCAVMWDGMQQACSAGDERATGARGEGVRRKPLVSPGCVAPPTIYLHETLTGGSLLSLEHQQNDR